MGLKRLESGDGGLGLEDGGVKQNGFGWFSLYLGSEGIGRLHYVGHTGLGIYVLGLRAIVKNYSKRVGDWSFDHRKWGLMSPMGMI